MGGGFVRVEEEELGIREEDVIDSVTFVVSACTAPCGTVRVKVAAD